MYCNAINPKLKLLLKNFQLSDDIAFRFSQSSWSDWPLTTEKFVGWLNQIDQNQEVVNLFMDYETFGEHQWEETGIFDFLRALPNQVFTHSNFKFHTPSELGEFMQPVSPIYVPYPMSWADEERDLTAWLGNELQDEAFDNLYNLEAQINNCTNEAILKDWKQLQTSDHFYYMCTKWFSDGDVHKYFNPYETPYDAFINYMNILSDFKIRLNKYESQSQQTLPRVIENYQGKNNIPKPASIGKTSIKKKPKKTYTFSGIEDISNADLKKILKNLNANQVSLALRDANPKVHEKMLKNISKTLLKDLSINPNEFVKKSEVDKSRKFIENLIKEYFD